MILTDTGPLVALFDARDPDHDATERVLAGLREPLVTTTPVLTEAFHLLNPKSRGAGALASSSARVGLGCGSWTTTP